MFKNKEGNKIPNVTFRVRVKDKWEDLSTESLFNNKTVVVFFSSWSIYTNMFF